MTRRVRHSLGLAGLFALAVVASAGAAQAQSRPCPTSNDIGNFNNELRRTDCGASIYEIPTNQLLDPPPPRRTVTVTPHQQDYSHFPISSVATFFNGLNYEERERVVRVAARHGLTDNDNRPMSVEDFGALTGFLDMKMNEGGYSPVDKARFLGQLAAEAHVYSGSRALAVGQDYGDGGPRYDYSMRETPNY